MNPIKTFRENAGLSQKAVALSLGVAQSAVSQWERGVTAPRCSRLQELAKLFRCTVDELVTKGGGEDASENT